MYNLERNRVFLQRRFISRNVNLIGCRFEMWWNLYDAVQSVIHQITHNVSRIFGLKYYTIYAKNIYFWTFEIYRWLNSHVSILVNNAIIIRKPTSIIICSIIFWAIFRTTQYVSSQVLKAQYFAWLEAIFGLRKKIWLAFKSSGSDKWGR